MERMLPLLSRRLGDRIARAVRAGGVRGILAGALFTSGLLVLLVAAGAARGASRGFIEAWGKYV